MLFRTDCIDLNHSQHLQKLKRKDGAPATGNGDGATPAKKASAKKRAKADVDDDEGNAPESATKKRRGAPKKSAKNVKQEIEEDLVEAEQAE